jgi:hypothetical protein
MLLYCLSAIIIYNLIDKYKQKLYFYPSTYISPTKNRIISPIQNHYSITNISDIKLKSNKPCLLISHGNAGNITNRDYLLDILNKYDGDIYCYEYPGFGKCEGSISINSCVSEHMFWLELLSNKYQQIDLWGESIGGGIVIETLCRLNKNTHNNIINKIGRIYLQSTFSSIYNVIRTLNPTLANFYYLLLFDDLETSRNLVHDDFISKFKHLEIIILHSRKDEVIPFSEAEINYNVCIRNKLNVKLIEIKGGHNNIQLPNIFQ